MLKTNLHATFFSIKTNILSIRANRLYFPNFAVKLWFLSTFDIILLMRTFLFFLDWAEVTILNAILVIPSKSYKNTIMAMFALIGPFFTGSVSIFRNMMGLSFDRIAWKVMTQFLLCSRLPWKCKVNSSWQEVRAQQFSIRSAIHHPTWRYT